MKSLRRVITAFLCVVISVPIISSVPVIQVEAKEKTITLSQVQRLAVTNSLDYQKIELKIDLQQIKYASAVKSVKMKEKKLRSFSWTPLLSFKFPESPTMADEYEWRYKPLQITYVIKDLKHQLNDVKLEVTEKVSILYIQGYIAQEKAAFYERSIAEQEKNLKRMNGQLAIGKASQSDIDKLKKSITSKQNGLASQLRTLSAIKTKLTGYINKDITTNYKFSNPLAQVDIPRSELTKIINTTLSLDQSLYEAKMDEQLTLGSMNYMYKLMQNKYGSDKMGYITSYINQAKNGEKINSVAFRRAYASMLEAVDAEWNGKIRIVFIRIPKVWFKGSTDGSRYVEDDPYALFSEALAYVDAVNERKSVEKELRNTVTDNFESLITAKNAYLATVEQSELTKAELDKATVLNKLGKYTYEELSDLQKQYEEEEMDALGLLSDYSQLIYSFNRLTCGAISQYIDTESTSLDTASGGNSYLAQETVDGAYYYIELRVEDNVFRLGINIPEDFSIDITHYELYVNETKIGGKTESDKCLEHLALDIDNVDKCEVYLYNEDSLVEICEINPEVYQDELVITSGYRVVDTDNSKVVATFTYSQNAALGTATINIKPKESESICYYCITDLKGNPVISDELIPIDNEFTYLRLLSNSFEDIKVNFYNRSEELMYTAVFNSMTLEITEE